MLNAFRHIISVPSLRFRIHHFFSSLAYSNSLSFHSRNKLVVQYDNPIDYFNHILSDCNNLHQVMQTHAQIISFGFQSSAFMASKLIAVCSRFTDCGYAWSVFQCVPDECRFNILLWNSMIRANVSHGLPYRALNLYMQMRVICIDGDGFTFPLVIRASTSIGDVGICEIIHGHVVVMGFQFHVHVCNELIGMYGKLGNMNYAQYLFDGMSQRNIISWNTMISGFAMNCDCKSASEMFKRMKSVGLVPNLVTWTCLLSSHARCHKHREVLCLFNEMRVRVKCSSAEVVAVVLSVCTAFDSLDKGREIHGYAVKSCLDEYKFVKNSLICLYGKLGKTKEARQLFREIKIKNIVSWNSLISCYVSAGLCDEALQVFFDMEKLGLDIKPNVVSWSAVIRGISSCGRMYDALSLFRQMQQSGVKPNVVTIANVLSTCTDLSSLSLGKEIHGHMIRSLMDRNVLVGNSLLHMYAECGNLKNAQLVFKRIECKDLISWNSLIRACGMHGFGEESVKILNKMINEGLKPDAITFINLLSACSHSGLVCEGRQLFHQMQTLFSITPQIEHYACVADLLGRAGFFDEANKFLWKMPMKPNSFVWSSLLNSGRKYENMDVIEYTAANILEHESEMTGSYMLLSNIYASKGRWEDSAKMRVMTKMRGLKKAPGQSWIEVKRNVYIFSSGKSVGRESEEIASVLEGLTFIMEAERYLPDKSVIVFQE